MTCVIYYYHIWNTLLFLMVLINILFGLGNKYIYIIFVFVYMYLYKLLHYNFIVRICFRWEFENQLYVSLPYHHYLFTQILYNSVFMKQNSGHLPERRPSRTNGWACKYV